MTFIRTFALAAATLLLSGCPVLPPENFTCETPGTGCGPFFLGPAVPLYANCLEIEGESGAVKVCFTCVCNIHDNCYTTCGSLKEQCDLAFLDGMLAECEAALGDDPAREQCDNRAYLYTALVVAGGQLSFDEGQRIGCGEDGEKARREGIRLKQFRETALPFTLPYDDEDNDFLPDDWERAVSLDPAYPEDALQDYDGDGVANLAEYLYGLDPFAVDSDADGVDDLAEIQP